MLTLWQGTPRRNRETTNEEQAEAGNASPEEASESTAKPRRRRVPKKATDGGVSEEADGSGDGKKSSGKTTRKGPPEDGIPSTSTVYVANIPFEYTDDKVRTNFNFSFFWEDSNLFQLKELFAIYNPTSAYIVPRQIPRFVIRKLAERGEPRKGRGFGFVTFPDEAAQKKAVEEMNGLEVDSRAISVKVAIDKPREKENGEHAVSVAANGSSA